MRERILELDLPETIEWFRGILRKLFSVDEDARAVKVDVPVGEEERYVIELAYENDAEKQLIVDELLGAGFKRQTKRISAEW
jgi:O-methyltransferase involved in polyketide biosynthesis